MKSSSASTSRERKTDVSTASMHLPKKTGTEKEIEKGAKIRTETEGVKERSERAAIVVAAADQSAGRAVRGVSAHREMAGPSASVGGVRERNSLHPSIAQEMVSHLHAPTGMRTTVVITVHGILSGSLHLLPCLTESWIAQSEAIALFERVKGGKGQSKAVILTTHLCLLRPTNTMSGPTTESIWALHLVYHKAKVGKKMAREEFRLIMRKRKNSGRRTRSKLTEIGT